MTTMPLVPPPPEPYPVLVSFAERAKQRRWTVLLRIFLIIPLLVATIVFLIANIVVVIIGWFGALFMGRTPKFTRDLSTITIRLFLRLQAYEALLSDQFPSFALEEHPSDTVRLAVPEATRMNRWAVFFRIILVIPANLLNSFVQAGLIPFLVFGWFAALITGWLPIPIFDLQRASIRFGARISAYFNLLVPTYPGKLFGDPAPTSLPTMQTDPPPALLPETPVVEPATPTMHPSWLLLLGKGGKRLLVVSIIIGIPAFVTRIVLQVTQTAVVINDQQLVQANNTLVGQIAQFETRGRGCQSAADVMSCVEANDGRLAGQLETFANTLSNSANFDISQSVVTNAQNAATTLADLFRNVSEAGPNEGSFKKAANFAVINKAANDVQTTLNALRTALNNR